MEQDKKKASSALKKLRNQNLVQDIQAGREFGKEILGAEGLGRLGTDKKIQETMSRFEDLSRGMSAQEIAARKSEAFQGIDVQQQTQSRALQAALARSGVKGGAAGAQQREMALGGLRAKAGVERDLLTSDYARRVAGLKDFANISGQVKQFDLAQAAAEKNLEMGSGLGFAQLGSAERQAAMAANAMRASAGQPESRGIGSSILGGAKGSVVGNILGGGVGSVVGAVGGIFCHHEDTEVEMLDGSFKKIKDLVLGDKVKEGGRVTLVSKMFSEYDMYEYKGEICTGSHPVLENNNWIYVKDSKLSKRREDMDESVICPIETDNGIYVTKAGYTSGTLDFEHEELIKNGGKNKYGENTKVYAM